MSTSKSQYKNTYLKKNIDLIIFIFCVLNRIKFPTTDFVQKPKIKFRIS